MGGWCLNVNLVIGFGPNLDLALWPRAKPINSEHRHIDLTIKYVHLKHGQAEDGYRTQTVTASATL